MTVRLFSAYLFFASELCVQLCLELLLRNRADNAVHNLAVLDNDHVRDAHNLEHLSKLRLIVRVDLADLNLALVLLCELLDDRCHHLAGTAPIRIEVNEHRLLRLQNFLLKISFCKTILHRTTSS